MLTLSSLTKTKKGKPRRTPKGKTTQIISVQNRDPLAPENEIDLGDLKVYPKLFTQPRLANQPYRIQRWVNVTDLTQAAGSDVFATYQFMVNDCSNTADFSSLFDQYRFVAVKAIFRPRFDFGALGSVAVNKLPRLYSVIDYDDNNAPTLISQLREYQTCKMTRFDEDHVRLIEPHMANLVFDNSGTTSFGNVRPQWVDMATLIVKHFGIKVAVEGGVVGQTNLQSWSVDFLYMMEFRH
jgi:hypothetical protein